MGPLAVCLPASAPGGAVKIDVFIVGSERGAGIYWSCLQELGVVLGGGGGAMSFI